VDRRSFQSYLEVGAQLYSLGIISLRQEKGLRRRETLAYMSVSSDAPYGRKLCAPSMWSSRSPSMVLSLLLVGSAIALLILTRCYLKCSPPASPVLASIVSLARDDMTYAAGRILDIVLATRD
jgi:hypothetical protein